jgi:gliding motility-associated-like protein
LTPRLLNTFLNLTLLLVLSFSVVATAQVPGPCDVKASFALHTDSVEITGNKYELHYFTNTSRNATDVRYLINDASWMEDDNFSYNFATGPNKITMVATNGICSDTLVYFLLKPGKVPEGKPNLSAWVGHELVEFIPRSLSITSNDGLLLGAKGQTRVNGFSYLIKLNKNGCVETAKTTDPWTDIRRTTSDGKGANVATIYSYGGSGGIIKMTDNLTPEWTKIYYTNQFRLYPDQYLFLPGNELFAVSNLGNYSGIHFLKLNGLGQPLWSRQLDLPGNGSTLVGKPCIIGSSIYIHYRTTKYLPSGMYEVFDQILSMDISSGNINWQKQIGDQNNHLWITGIENFNNKLLVAGHWTIRPEPNFLVGLALLDANGNIEKTVNIRDVNNVVSGGEYAVRKADANHFYFQISGMNMEYNDYGAYHSLIAKMDDQFQFTWKRQTFNRQRGPLGLGAVSTDGGLATMGYWMGNGINPREGLSYRLYLQKFDPGFTNSSQICEFNDIDLVPVPITNPTITNIPLTSYTLLPLLVKDTSFAFTNVNPEVRYRDGKCYEYLDSCSMVKIDGPLNLCDLSKQYTFKAWRNEYCFQPVTWELPPNAQQVSKDESSITVKFNSAGNHLIKAFLTNTCVPARDSMNVYFEENPAPPLELGNDTAICPGTNLLVQAQNGYLSYRWQDGSTNSSINTGTAGKYWVRVTDVCNNEYSDTINITIKENLTLNAGEDQLVCPGAALTLTAPDGYSTYTWKDAMGNHTTSGKLLEIQTAHTNEYYLEATLTAGCIAYDTVQVNLFTLPSITLGNDTSFCQGGSVELNAGPDYATYLWSNGSQTQKITAASTGNYSVTATTQFGCTVMDELRIVNVYSKPIVNIQQNGVLCKDVTKTLSPGDGFSAYQWQDNSTRNKFTASTTGKYWVTVTDRRGCTGSDTTLIHTVSLPPGNFFPADTTICDYSSLLLSPDGHFSEYKWNTNAGTAAIEIKNAGQYWLQVKDEYGCTGSDTILVKTKECMYGVYFPNAFSPDNNWNNDRFKPMVFGNLVKYEFSIFSRFGTRIFFSKDSTKGWDGTINGMPQDSNHFIWTCTYQLVGQPVKKEKGIVLLMR